MIKYTANLGHRFNRPGCQIEVTLVEPTTTSGYTASCRFSWEGKYQPYTMDNLHDDGGFKKTFEYSERGARIAANWFVCQYDKQRSEKKARQYRERQAIRQAA
jgi:hypothetical protein